MKIKTCILGCFFIIFHTPAISALLYVLVNPTNKLTIQFIPALMFELAGLAIVGFLLIKYNEGLKS